jgi:phage/plasmid-like protein (TIGR03299 family)
LHPNAFVWGVITFYKELIMAHELATAGDMAYVGETPWHGLGNALPQNQPIEVWQEAAGMDFEIKETEVLYSVSGTGVHLKTNPENKVLFRSDTYSPLSVVSKRYKVVQPRQVLEFYRDLVSAGGFELETAGILKGGKKLWALARTGQETVLRGGDTVKAYLLLATSCDGTLCTTAQFTSVRVVCNNTLNMAVGDRTGAVKVPHSTQFDPEAVKRELGLGLSAWDVFMTSIKGLADRKVHKFEAMNYLVKVLGNPNVPLADQPNQTALNQVYALFSGGGKGSDLDSASGTSWGLLNAVTEYVDHERRARSQDNRLDSAWFGPGAAIKSKAFEEAMKLAA